MITWNIIKTIDEGGFGKVHEVLSSEKKRGALKELKNSSPNNLQRFKREVGILQNFSHSNIIGIYDWNLNGSPTNNVGPWYIMEYMEGGNLHNQMVSMFNVQKGLFAQKWALGTVILPIIDALNYAHTHATHTTFHRDLKPANLLFTTTTCNHIKVADWGLGKDINKESLGLTAKGLGGTKGYSAPEQWYDLEVDGRADIFSLGVIFYQMMTGNMPPEYDFKGGRAPVPLPSKAHPSILTKAPLLDNIILKMIEIKAENRYQTFQQLKSILTPIYNKIP